MNTMLMPTINGYQEFTEESLFIVAEQINKGNKKALTEYIYIENIDFLLHKFINSGGLGFHEQFIGDDLVDFLFDFIENKTSWDKNILFSRITIKEDSQDFKLFLKTMSKI